jgi:hypothetical protein
MGRYVKRFGFPQAAATFSLVVGLISLTGLPLLATNKPFSVPDDIAVRIRLDDTLTSTDSQIGDPFSATVVDKGDYQNARVYGHVAQIDMSGKIKGHTSMMLRFDRFVMPDGRRAQIHAEIIELYHAPSGEKVDVEGAIESGGRGRKTIAHTAIGGGSRRAAWRHFRRRQGRRYWFHHRRRRRAGNNGFPRTPEDQSEQRPGNVDPHHRRVRVLGLGSKT